MRKTFAEQVREAADKIKLRQEAIFKESAQAVMERANTPKAQGGNMPVVTGFLRNSVRASTEGAPGSGDGDPPLVFATMKVGDTVTVGWTAAYAMRMEHGFEGEDSLGRTYSQQGNGFLRLAVQGWNQIVKDVAADVRQRIK